MHGYDMSWASFHIIEVMSSPKFFHKRAGYLAAAQSFQQDTDVLMLTTNLIKKDLSSPNALDIGVTINGLSHILTPDLARDLCQDLVAMLNHSRPYIRKKVVLVLYKVFLKFPEGLRLSFPRLKERLDDPDPSVISASVNVICELARKNPRNYLSLAPQLFHLLTNSSNNWMSIKIVKLFSALTPLEPRLAKKLLPSIISLIQSTPAMSLLYECIHTVITGGFLDLSQGDNATSLAAMCVEKLKTFLTDSDQNLKYIGLLALGKILPTHPRLVVEHRELVLECIEDADFSIRMRALDLIVGMVNRKNLMDIVKRLMSHLVPSTNTNAEDSADSPSSTIFDPLYRADIINRILFICSQNSYANITNFEWYIAVLIDLTYVAGVSVGQLLSAQIMDVGVRVKSVRPYTVKVMCRVLSDKKFLETASLQDSNAEVLYAAAWICGEYSSYLEDVPAALECLLQPNVLKLSTVAQAVYVQNILKIYAFWTSTLVYQWDIDVQEEFIKVTAMMRERIGLFCRSVDLEVQERACNTREVFDVILQHFASVSHIPGVNDDHGQSHAATILSELPPLFFSYELNPVAPKAQKKVPVPEGLNLDAWINAPILQSDEGEEEVEDMFEYVVPKESKKIKKGKKGKAARDTSDDEEEVIHKRRTDRLERMKLDPYYIALDSPTKKQATPVEEDLDVDSIPIVKLSMDDFKIQSLKKSKSGKKSKHPAEKKPRERTPSPIVFADEDVPDNAIQSASDGEEIKESSSSKKSAPVLPKKDKKGILDADYSGLIDVDLNTPLGENEKFPQIQAYMSPEESRRREESRTKLREKEEVELKKQQKKPKSSIKVEAVETKKPKKNSKKEKQTKPSTKQSKKEKSLEPTKKSKSKEKAEQVPEEPLVQLENPEPLPPIAEYQPLPLESPVRQLINDGSLKISSTFKLLTTDLSEKPIVNIKFNFTNISESLAIVETRLHFTQSFDVEYRTSQSQKDSMTEDDSIFIGGDLLPEALLEENVEFVILGNARIGLCIRGDVKYNSRSEDGDIDNHVANFELFIPMAVFMLQIPYIDPTAFATLLAEHGSDFTYRHSTRFPLSHSSEIPNDQALNKALEIISQVTQMRVVEIVPGAASLYGKSVQEYQVAGLVKYTVNGSGENREIVINVDLRGGDDDFCKGLLKEVTDVFNT